MANLFVTDTNNSNIDTDEDLDLTMCLEHPRVTKVTIMPDGTLVAELSNNAEGTNDIIRKEEGLHKGNKTGFRGVSIRGDKYRADVSHEGVQYNLGSFNTKQEAIEARLKAEMELGK